MKDQTEMLATKDLAQGDHKAAMEMLRLPEHIDTNYSRTILVNGMLIGCALLLSALLIYYYFYDYAPIQPTLKDMREMFMYRLMLFPILMILFVGINVRIWVSAGINCM